MTADVQRFIVWSLAALVVLAVPRTSPPVLQLVVWTVVLGLMLCALYSIDDDAL